MNNKVIVNFTEPEYKAEIETLQNNVRRLNKGKFLCSDITNGEVQDLDFPAVNKWLKSYSPMFFNIKAIAELLNKTQEYIDAGIIYGLKDSLQGKYITEDENGYVLTDESIQVIKDNYTTYLDSGKAMTYKTLQKAIDLLNQLEPADLNCLQKTYEGLYMVNLFKLNHTW
jgi:hypothetical protein